MKPVIKYNQPDFDPIHYPVTDFMIRSITAIPDIINFNPDELKDAAWWYTATVHGVIFTLNMEGKKHNDHIMNARRLDPTKMLELINKIENFRFIEVNGNELTIALDH